MTPETFLTLALQCAPLIHPSTSADIARVESGFNAFAIAEIVPKSQSASGFISHLPASKEGALTLIKAIEKNSRRYSVGIMQITSTNFKRYAVTAEDLLNPCINLSVYQKILTDCYQRGGSLKRALSCYYSGSFTAGLKKEKALNSSYLQRIGYVVPGTSEDKTIKPDKPDKPVIIYPSSVVRGISKSSNETPKIIYFPPRIVRGIHLQTKAEK